MASQFVQYCSDERKFADSGEMCSVVVILGLVLALVLAQGIQDNMPQHLIHVRLAHQVSHYNHQICRPRKVSRGTWRTFDPNIEILQKWSEDKSTLTLIFKPL